MVSRIEDAALDASGREQDKESRRRVTELMRQRLSQLYRQMVGLVGADEASQLMQEVLGRSFTGAKHGDD